MKRILAISLLLIFIAGQVNLTLATHFCGKDAVDTAVSIGKDKMSCGPEKGKCCDEDVEEVAGPVITSQECCSNDYYSSDADDYFIKTETGKDEQLLFVAICVTSFYNHTFFSHWKSFQTKNFSVLITPDKQVLYQSFLL